MNNYFNKALSSWTLNDVLQMIDLEVEEGVGLDYKMTLPDKADSSRKEFLYDFSSFCNAFGGYLIFGVSEKIENNRKTNRPHRIEGIESDPVQDVARLEQIVANGIFPRFSGYEVKVLTEESGKFVVIFRIRKSWYGPHMVSVDGNTRFYTRNQNGKLAMDYSQIRSSFNSSESMIEKIDIFLKGRLRYIELGEGPTKLTGDSLFVIQIVPIDTFSQPVFSVADLKGDGSRTRPFQSQYTPHERVNLEGVFRYESMEDNTGFVQIFRTGTHEYADSYVLHRHQESGDIYMDWVGGSIFNVLKMTFDNLKRLNVSGPVLVRVILRGVKGRAFKISNRQFRGDQYKFDRDLIVLPDLVIEEESWESKMKDIMNPLCNAAGYDKCSFIDDNGFWSVVKS